MTTDNASQDANQPTVGKRLRQAREIAGLSVAEVASKQHLRPVIISAIESGDYRRIDSELFLKGYVRAYAAHVGIDPESVIRQLDKELEPLREEQKARVEASPLITIERRKRRKRQMARIVAILLALAALFYAGTLYLASQEPPASSAENEPAAEEADETGSSLPVESMEEDGNLLDEDAPADPPATDSGTTAEEGESQGSVMPVELEENGESDEASGDGVNALESDMAPSVGDAGSSSPVSGQPVVEPDSAAGDGAGSSTADSTVAEQEASVPENSEGRLVVEFSGDCWVEVQDSTGRTLVAELRRAGETLDVTGNGPLRVVLGAVSAVSAVSYSGESVNLSDRRARNDRVVLNLSD